MPYDFCDFVLLANSRKHRGVCIAGKNHLDKSWVRPVYDSSGGAVPTKKTKNWKLLQHVSVPTLPSNCFRQRYQAENVLIDQNGQWCEQEKYHDYNNIKSLLDGPDSIWTFPGETDPNKVSMVTINRGIVSNSLYFLKINNMVFNYSWTYDQEAQHSKLHLKARFKYREVEYEFPVTDPCVEKAFVNKEKGLYHCSNLEIFACVSLGEPYNGYCYKLVASIICGERCLRGKTCDQCQCLGPDIQVTKGNQDPRVNQVDYVKLLELVVEQMNNTNTQTESPTWEEQVKSMIEKLLESRSDSDHATIMGKLKELGVDCIDKRSTPGGNLWILDKQDPRVDAVIEVLNDQGAKFIKAKKRAGWYRK